MEKNQGNLALKLRPKTFGEVWGNYEMLRTLQENLKKRNHSQTYLFSGPRGCGKTTVARIVAEHVGVSELREINIADQRNIDDARAIIEEIKLPPIMGGKRVYILDECHAANSTWMDAILKDLEEPPAWVYFILCTTEPKKLKSTVISRCEQYAFSPLSSREMFPELVRVVSTMNVHKVPIAQNTLEKIYYRSAGSPRDALILLGQVLSARPEDVEEILLNTMDEPETVNICTVLLNRGRVSAVMAALKLNKKDPESIRRGIIGYLAAIMERSPESTNGIRAAQLFGNFIEPLYNTGRPGLVYQLYSSVMRTD